MGKKKKNSNYKNGQPVPAETKPASKKGAITGLIIAAVLLALGVWAFFYFHNGYEPTPDALDALQDTEWYSVRKLDGATVFVPEEPRAGFILYPGARVEHTAYATLMQELAIEKILCVMVDMPLDQPSLDKDAAARFRDEFPQITDWYIGGHSKGGQIAADHVSRHTEDYKGLVLLAAYATVDLSDTDLKVATLYGDRDQLLDMDRYKKCLRNLPKGYYEDVIEGGNHGNFGNYGPHDGDRIAGLSAYVQCKITAEAIVTLISSKS